MSAVITAGALAEALKDVEAIMHARNAIDVLNCILLKADGDRITATATNLDGWLSSFATADVKSPFAACVDRRIAKVAAGLPEAKESTLELKEGALHLRCGRSRYRFECTPVENFPEAPAVEGGVTSQRSDEEIERLFKQAASAVSTEETRYYLCGTCLEKGGIGVSTHGHALISASISAHDDAKLTWRPIVSGAACKIIAKMGAATLQINDRLISAQNETLHLTHKLIDGVFPDWRRLVPEQSGNCAEFDREEMLDALARLKHAADSNVKMPGVRVRWDASDCVRLSLPDADRGEEIIDATARGAASFACNAKYLTELLDAIDTPRATMANDGPGEVIKLTSSDDAGVVAICMPMRF
jgi:DNA polymerase III subunit beta